ncbi:hypothetical protein MTO96_027807 [Rhipicephalus appendiculatus]
MYCATSESADLRLSVADILSSMANGVPEPPATTTVSDRTTACRSVSSGYARAWSCARRYRHFHRLLRALGLSEALGATVDYGTCLLRTRAATPSARYLARPRLEAPDRRALLAARNDRFSPGNGRFRFAGLMKVRL